MNTKRSHKKQKPTNDQSPIIVQNNNDNIGCKTTVLHMSSNVTEIIPDNFKITIIYNQL